MSKNHALLVEKEYDFVIAVLRANGHLADRKIEFIKAFRNSTGYGLRESKNIVESYLGQSSTSIWLYLSDVADIPTRTYDGEEPKAIPSNPPRPQLYIVVYSGRVEYTAHSLDEARRVVELLNGLDRYGSKIYSQVQ